MREVVIRDGNTIAKVMPAFGGVVSSFCVEGTEVLRMNEKDLGIANCLAGGIPVLFPFSSKVENDTYSIDGVEYTMPMHGFVKDMPFAVESASENAVTVYAANSEAIKKQSFPFDFLLHIEYKVNDSSLFIKATVENLSDKRMPFYIGWHTYFKTSSKADTEFTFDFKEYTSYLDASKGSLENEKLNLNLPLDHVYKGIGEKKYTLTNYADGYEAQTIVDDMHEVLTVCTAFDDCACIEPWTAVPNAINTGEKLRYVEPKSSVSCGFEIKVRLL